MQRALVIALYWCKDGEWLGIIRCGCPMKESPSEANGNSNAT
jgi:hypothetical protein